MLRSVRYSLLSKSKVFLFSNIAQTLYEVKIIFNSMSRRTPHVKTNKNARLKMPRRPAEARPFVMQMRSESVEVLPEPVRSPLDKKQYKTIKLQNGIVALLISDLNGGNSIESSDCEESATCEDSTDGSDNEYSDMSENESREGKEFAEEKMAACALSVGVGSFSDPADIQGMAHFVEHMVFMGSKKYPKENDFDSFIKKKGGSDNAATDCEITTFYFEVQEKHVGQALDKFSQFFVSPLMKQEAMQREREAIESEFAIATPSDSNRREQLLCSLFPEGHPLRTFSWGNLKSLKEMVPSDTYLHRQAHAFRDRHYSAHRMTVAIQARLELETLEQMVINTFGLVPSNHLPPADYTNYTYSRQLITTEFHSLYYMKPVNDAIELHLVWCMKEMMSLYKSKPHQYVSFLIGHEGPGSLLSYLKNKVWALGIYAGNNEDGIDYTSIHSLFSTQIVLTQEGYQHLDQVLAAVFSYIKMIQSVGPSPELFEEIKSIADTEHRYEQERQPSDNVEALVENMQLFPPEHFLVGDILYFNYDPQEIEYILNILSPETVNIIVLSKENTHVGKKIEYDATEQWFGTEYKRIEIPPEWKQAWRNIKPYEEFHTPPENIYISTNFDLIPVPTDQRLEGKIVSVANPHSKREQKTYVCKSTDDAPRIKSKKNISPYDPVVYGKGALARTNYNQPHLLRKDDRMEVWYKPDYKFRLPNAFMYFYFLTSLSVKTAKDNCLLDLWSVMLNHDLREAVYAANMAGLSHNVYMSDKGLILKAEGYNQKLHLLVDVITLRMRECSGALTPAMFTAIKDSQSKLYYNQGIKPGKLAKELRLSILLEPYCSTLKRLRALESVTFSDLQTFGDRFLDNLYAQVLVQGNLSEEEALAVADLVQRNVAWKGLPEEHIPKVVACELPRSVQICRVSSLNTKDTNSVITNYYQSNLFNWRENAIIEVLMMLMEEPVFDTLRTKEQLGYSVFCQHRYSSGVLGYSLTVNTQADKYSESHVDERIETFLKSFAKDIRKLDERELAETKESLIKLKQTVDVELKEEVSRNWGEITAMEYTFDRLQREVAAIQRVTLADLKEWFKQHSGRGSNYRKLSVQFWKFKYNPKVKLKLKQTVDVELKEEVSRNWGEITAMEYTFDRLQREVAAIQRVTLADLKEWFKQHSGRGSNYRKLSVQVVGHSNKSNNESQTTPPETNGKTSPAQELHFLSDSVLDNGHGNLNFILNVQTYRENLPLYPDITVKLDNC